MNTSPDLIFDVGMHSGEDSAYYLHLGYRVIGIEANPILAGDCTARFEKEIRENRMTILNAGVLKESGQFTFYRNLQDPLWSSFEPEKGKKPGEWQKIEVPCLTTRQLIADYGRPFFVKVDIEGADLQALHSLTPDITPPYVSLELSLEDPIVERLIELGYGSFKFVDGCSGHAAPRIFDHQPGWRMLRKASRTLPFLDSFIRSLPQALRNKSEWNPPGKHRASEYPFGIHHSGPFGEAAAGEWMDPKSAIRWFNELKQDYIRSGLGHELWWDVHARHVTAPQPSR